MQTLLLAGGGFVHSIDPVLLRVGGIKLYYYGLAYALGFCGIHFWLRARRERLGWSVGEVYESSILIAIAVLLFGRAFEIVVYEWEYYKTHLLELPSYWNGGMASHGVLLGAIVGIFLFSRLRDKSFLRIVDEVAIPAAFLLALGRIGNFINGQICGSVTDAWWGVRFPDAEGFRHPVTLYESLKNLMIIPILLLVRRKWSRGEGKVFAHFVFWYGFLRLFTDYFREYGTEFLGIGTGQYFNLSMALAGVVLYIWFSRIRYARHVCGRKSKRQDRALADMGQDGRTGHGTNRAGLVLRRAALTGIILFSVTIPSGWTQGVLKQYRDAQISKRITGANRSGVSGSASGDLL
jgi:phosphatidylglycerol:prolipoprotein diacylglycerol transferase